MPLPDIIWVLGCGLAGVWGLHACEVPQDASKYKPKYIESSYKSTLLLVQQNVEKQQIAPNIARLVTSNEKFVLSYQESLALQSWPHHLNDQQLMR